MNGPAPALIRRFPANTLPWIVAACAVVVFSLTLNPWVSFSNAQQVARVSGWLWEPDLSGPLLFLATLPLRLLPEAWIPVALNLLNALCAAAVLGLLARSVAILPHNRTHEQRVRAGLEGYPLAFRSAWLPPAVAAAICGLQLTFWENATAGTPVMLDLLLFAWVIRSLLEYRLTGKPLWLYQTAFLVGAGMANSFALVGFLPVYLLALLVLKGLRLFEPRFFLRMTLLGLLGTSLYLLMPLLQSANADVTVGFWQSLKHILVSQKLVLFNFPKKTLLLLSIWSLFPILLISIRWPQNFGDVNPQGTRFATFAFHLVHAAFLTLCIWVAFDPAVSPRNAGLGLPFLTFYYLSAIAIGYFAGYFLLLFRKNLDPAIYTYGKSRPSASNRVIVVALWILCLVAPLGLAFVNLPTIQLTNSTALREYASLIVEAIPEGDTVVLSDDSTREFLLRAAMAQRGQRTDVILLNTSLLVWPQYHKKMAETYPDRWPVPPPTNMELRLADQSLVNLMLIFSRSNQVCYAHPSFGYYFEQFIPQPAGILNLLHPFPPEELVPPPMSEATAIRNEKFWNDSALRLLTVVQEGKQRSRIGEPADTRATLMKWFHIENKPNRTVEILGAWLSRSLTSYGVDLQRAGRFEEAAKRFTQARELNPDNLVAEINLKSNTDLQAGRPSTVTLSKTMEAKFEEMGWQQMINANGLFDEPRLTMAQGQMFLQGRLFRQALREIHRVRTLVPNEFAPNLWYARLLSVMGRPEEALKIAHTVQAEPKRFGVNATNQLELVFVTAAAYLGKQEPEQAEATINTAIAANPANTNLMNAALQMYMNAGLFTNALRLIETQLASHPDDPNHLVNKGFALLRMEDNAAALAVLSRALELQTNNSAARMNRAIANLKLNHLDAAESDYEQLLLQFPKAHQIYYGLGEIASRRNDTNQAIYNFQLYLTNAPPQTKETQEIRKRLEALRGATP